MGFSEIVTPASYNRIELLDKHRHCDRCFPAGSLSDLLFEVVYGFLSRVDIQRSLTGIAFDLVRSQL